ncbi:3-hydroxyisobutyryl-CoA hydrolase, mitochondrial-like isoform X3 [Limulus polyphemus]|uniref:3-hydroxyisobutyryl-CoA hydrolase, mitochondrial n=1 Tax=Limulus polyphemus TaxID=6850 RepID=A0ABM1TMY2_LIMPO|nr:3-hydroxyisobutyryl-CoA hydrolase, mitochondrial-like isoform X3 [Limulus polyphemus]XP_022257239.1 3-hydroxyisobutyryl-CoA hydrolase, mitochondrial-like isoform X3 [Limulus polyphemus]
MILRVVKRFCWKRLTSSILRNISTLTTDEVILDKIGNKGIVTLNRPKALNALSMTMIRKILNQMKGAGLSVHGHFRVATERTVFAMPEAAIGFFASVGGSHFLPRLQGKLGLYLALTGCRLTGHDVVKAGVATHFVDSGRINTIEEKLLKMESPSFQEIDKLLCKNQEQSPIKDGDLSFQLLLSKINTQFDGGSLNAIIENLRRDKSEWANQHLQTLFKMAITHIPQNNLPSARAWKKHESSGVPKDGVQNFSKSYEESGLL